MTDIQSAKTIVRQFYADFDRGAPADLKQIAERHCAASFLWRGMHPLCEIDGMSAVVDGFWIPLRSALAHMQRREDIFFAGHNDADDGASVWTCSMGHMMGLFDADFIGIPATGRMAFLRYAEFFKVEDGRLTQSAFFCDLVGLMHQAGCYPLPPMTGASFVYPGPRTHDGLIFAPQDQRETDKTMSLINQMIENLSKLNDLDGHHCPPELLQQSWHDGMIWYGPCGIGASYTIARYQRQHQHPFRLNLTDKSYNGHVARVAEGSYCGFFGWANLKNRNTGGFLGLPEARSPAEMRVVDLYRRDGDKIAENWVFIDLPYYLAQQGLDVFERLRELRGWDA